MNSLWNSHRLFSKKFKSDGENSTMKQVKVALVGIGGYGINALDDILHKPDPLIDLVGVVEPYPERCSFYGELMEKKVPAYTNMDDLYAKHEVDLTVISTPIFLHAVQIIKALEHGSNVLCEKPLCADERDIDRIAAARDKSGKFVYIGYQWSYSPAITELKKDVLEGKFGDLIEMKCLVLRPRNRAYFNRGVGWAGKIQTADGQLIYDSVANNAAAHYLFNMMYIMGEEGKAAEASDITAELLRANPIENFDACKINFKMRNGAKACFIAAHPVLKGIEPIFEYQFEKGVLYYANEPVDASYGLMPADYTEYGQIVAYMNDGTQKIYGDPMSNHCKKLHDAVQAIVDGVKGDGPCGLDATAAHTRLINFIQKNYPILDVKEACLKEENTFLYADGLFETCVECYKNTDVSIACFGE